MRPALGALFFAIAVALVLAPAPAAGAVELVRPGRGPRPPAWSSWSGR